MTTRVLICIPCLDMCASDFALSLAALMAHTTRDSLRREVSVSLWSQKGSIIMDARNAAVEAALTHDATHLLFLDSDMVFPPDTLQRLLYHKKDVVGATYVKRYPPHEMLGTYERAVGFDVGEELKAGLRSALSLPFGCILLKVAALEKVKRPLFRYMTTENGTISEDEWMCIQAREAGLTIWCDLNLTREVGHVGSQVFRVPN